MNKLYQEISKELIDAIYLYMNDKITLEELQEVNIKENLLFNYNKWDKLKKQLKENIFLCTKKLYEELNIVERDLKHLDKICKVKEIELDLEGVLAHAHILGRNRMPPKQYIGSNWYVEPFPTLQMVPSLQEKNEEFDCDSSYEN